MLPPHLKRNESEISVIKEIVDSGNDRPVLMLNMNRYTPEAGFAKGELYRQYLGGLEALLKTLGAKILWRLPVLGQPVGEQKKIDEILAIWFPSHKAYLDVAAAPGAEDNYRLRALCVERAVIHRCPGEPSPLVYRP